MRNIIPKLTPGFAWLPLLITVCISIFSPVNAEVVVNPEKVMLPVNAALKDSLGRDKTILSSAAIKDSQGRLAKGMHNIDFSLDPSSPYPLMVEGTLINPGSTVRFSKNLSLTSSTVMLSVRPAVNGIVGSAIYTIDLPSIKVEVCPEGMTETVANCQQILFAEPTLGCDAGYTLAGSVCTQTITAPKEFKCADGFTLQGDQCTGGPTTTAVASCPTGHSYNAANECEATKFTAYTVCPPGFSDVITHCEKTTRELKVSEVCPVGFVDNPTDPTSCIKTEQIAKSTYCEGVENTGTQACTGTGADKVCTTFDQAKAACEVKTYKLSVLECGPDYVLSGGVCQLNKPYTISATCPDGFTRTPGTGNCEKVSTVAATPKCPAGYTMNGTTCSKADSIPIESCPAGYYYINSKCNLMVTANVNCSSGYTWNGTVCSKTETTAATGDCTSPYAWNGTTCQQTQTATGTYGCPTNYTWNGSTCVSPYVNDVNPNGWRCGYNDVARPQPTGPNQYVCYEVKVVNCPSGYGLMPEDNALCFRTQDVVSASYQVCPPSHPYHFTDNTYRCTTQPGVKFLLHVSDSSVTCPSGYNEDGSYGCVSQTATASIGYAYSEPMLTYNSSTYKMEGYLTSNKVNTCPSGYTYVSGTTCQKVTTQTPSSYSCPAGWSVSGAQCTRTLTTTETRTCNTGYTLATPTFPTNCYNNNYANNVGNCKSGYTLSGTVCNGTLSEPVTYDCSPGWVVSGDKCNQVVNELATINCASPFTDNGANCAMNMTDSANKLCVAPYLWSAADNKCKAVITTPKL